MRGSTPRRRLLLACAALSIGVLVAPAARAQEIESATDLDRAVSHLRGRSASGAAPRHGVGGPEGRWGLELRGGWIRLFDVELDEEGSFEVDRIALQADLIYRIKPDVPLTLTLGYRLDHYDFDGPPAFGSTAWGDVHSFRATVPLGMPLGERLFLLLVPSVGTAFEAGAKAEDGVSWGAFGGAVWKANERLSVGPGFVLSTEIEDDLFVYPILLVEWEIVPTLTLETGRGLGATAGPGLYFNWDVRGPWELSFGGRFDRLRFRLDENGPSPGGVGEDSAFSLALAARYVPKEDVSFNVTLGASFWGELRIEDAGGSLIGSSGYDTTFFAGMGFRLAF